MQVKFMRSSLLKGLINSLRLVEWYVTLCWYKCLLEIKLDRYYCAFRVGLPAAANSRWQPQFTSGLSVTSMLVSGTFAPERISKSNQSQIRTLIFGLNGSNSGLSTVKSKQKVLQLLPVISATGERHRLCQLSLTVRNIDFLKLRKKTL